jgi:hypothetical protein
MSRLLAALALVALALPPVARADVLALYQNRTDGSTRLFNLNTNAPLGVALVDCCRTVHGTLGFNPASSELLLVQTTVAGGQELVRISAATGAISGRAALTAGWQVVAASYDRVRSTWFALAGNAGSELRLVTINTGTGAIAPVGAGVLAAGTSVVAGAHGLHPARGQWHLLGALGGSPLVARVLTLDLVTGSLLASPALSAGVPVSNLHFDEGSGYLVGLGRVDATGFGLAVRIDPGTGVVQPTASTGTLGCCAWTASALAAQAATGIGFGHFTDPDTGLAVFFGLALNSGAFGGTGGHDQAWAIHGLVSNQTAFIGDAIFGNGFDLVNKPTGQVDWDD